MFETILVPVDFSIGTETQVRIARELARASGAKLLLLHVREPLLEPGDFLPPRASDTTDFDLVLEAMKLELTRGGSRVEARSIEGSPAREIIAMAREEGASLIVMGTHGRTGLKHALLGSVAENVMRGAPCPVLTLKLSGAVEASKR